MHYRAFALALILSAVAACGGGGDDDEEEDDGPDDVDPAGYYLGTVTTAAGTQAADLLVTADSRFMLLAPGVMYATGAGTSNVSSFNASGVALRLPAGATFSGGAPVSGMSFSGSAVERVSVTGNFSGGGLTGSYNFGNYRATTYERASSLAIVAGVYQGVTGVNGTQLITTTDAVLSVSSGGGVTYNDNTGCVGTGTATVPNPARNYYNLTLTLTGCSSTPRNTTYTLLSFMAADPAGNFRVLNTGGQNGATPATFFLFQGAR